MRVGFELEKRDQGQAGRRPSRSRVTWRRGSRAGRTAHPPSCSARTRCLRLEWGYEIDEQRRVETDCRTVGAGLIGRRRSRRSQCRRMIIANPGDKPHATLASPGWPSSCSSRRFRRPPNRFAAPPIESCPDNASASRAYSFFLAGNRAGYHLECRMPDGSGLYIFRVQRPRPRALGPLRASCMTRPASRP